MRDIIMLNHLKYGGRICMINLEDLVPFQLLISHAVHCNSQYQEQTNSQYEEQTVSLVCPVQNIAPIGY